LRSILVSGVNRTKLAGRRILTDQLERSGDVDCGLDRSCHRTSICMYAMHTFNRFALGLRSLKFVMRVDAPDNQNVSFQPDLASDFGNQFAIAGINLARLQRTAKSTGQSAACCGHNVIQSGCARREFVRRDLVMLGNFRMHAKWHRLLFRRQPGKSQGPNLPFDPNPRRVNGLFVFRHQWPYRSSSSNLAA
jgi:hypothetical protein